MNTLEAIQEIFGLKEMFEKWLIKQYEFAELIAAAEREACAKVADEWQTAIHDPRYECDCSEAIRARGNT